LILGQEGLAVPQDVTEIGRQDDLVWKF